MTSLSMAWRTGRATRTVRPRRTPVLIRLATWAGRNLPTWKRARTAVMQTGAVAAGVYGLFEWTTVAGWIGLCVGLFVLEALGGEK